MNKKQRCLYFIKIKSFSDSVNTIMKIKRPPVQWEKIFENQIPDKALVIWLFKQLLQLIKKKKKPKHYNLNIKNLNRYLS